MSDIENSDLVNECGKRSRRSPNFNKMLKRELLDEVEIKPDETIRDQQYEEVFARMKAAYSVAVLEDFLNGKRP